jgi:MbtH protein
MKARSPHVVTPLKWVIMVMRSLSTRRREISFTSVSGIDGTADLSGVTVVSAVGRALGSGDDRGRPVPHRRLTTGVAVADTEEDPRTYRVVRNSEEQYSIWPADRELPAGWMAEGTTGSKESCLDRIAEVWTDMRPASLR